MAHLQANAARGRGRAEQVRHRGGALLSVAFLVLLGCGEAADTLDAAGGGDGSGAGSLPCALTGCEIAKLAATSSMPTGIATYDGRASITTLDALDTVITTNADFSMAANFNARSVSVSLTAIQTGTTNFTGSATGTGSISGNTLSAGFSGVISAPSVGASVLSGTLSGTFRGTAAAAVDGEVTITGGGATGGDAYGRFFGNRQ